MHSKIHINQHVIRSNNKLGGDDPHDPVVTIKGYRTASHKSHCDNTYGHEVEILDPAGTVVARVRYRPSNPLPCGAKVWIETDCTVRPVLWPDRLPPKT
jgi:hypothetical protein